MSCLKAIFQGNDKSCKKWQRRAIEWSNENLILVKKKKLGEEERSGAGGWRGAPPVCSNLEGGQQPSLSPAAAPRPDVPTARPGPAS